MWIELENIHKRFGETWANRDVSFSIAPGSIHGILGENGAGKSTLMKILTGFISKTSGTVRLAGRKVDLSSPGKAASWGIGMLYQDPMDFPRLTVLENFFLRPGNGFFTSRKNAEKNLLRMVKDLGFSLRPQDAVSTLTVGERQQLELLRILHAGVNVLILDEPTTGISEEQRRTLFQALRTIAETGKTVIIVSHKLKDVEALCDRVTVLRRGAVAGEMEKPFDKTALLAMMFGEAPAAPTHTSIPSGREILVMDRVSAPGGRTGLQNCSAVIRQNEIVGLAGLEGSGQGIFLRLASGMQRPASGSIFFSGADVRNKNYHFFRDRGAAFMPAARLEEGLMPSLTIAEHAALADRRFRFFLSRQSAHNSASKKIEEYGIVGTPDSKADALSGGNQQRMQLSFLPPKPKLLLLENPTRGLDLSSARWVWKKLHDYCGFHTSIVFYSPDLDELLTFSDRLLVFFNGKLIAEFQNPADPERVSRAVAGVV